MLTQSTDYRITIANPDTFEEHPPFLCFFDTSNDPDTIYAVSSVIFDFPEFAFVNLDTYSRATDHRIAFFIVKRCTHKFPIELDVVRNSVRRVTCDGHKGVSLNTCKPVVTNFQNFIHGESASAEE